ncbi:hypothetical protein GGX14DRAFT_537297 [Mycena pura]|uniref:Uncharacterized protein n=1 Tax=Mycena pura TaxID=153505 RepID=A0AAD6UWH1_9AGAR|nr:hypothetical protein GGX14DRAFT_537297 [Mycena pura]
MPPRGSGGAALSETDFEFDAERKHVECRTCKAVKPPGETERRDWILVRNGARHLEEMKHKQAIAQLKDAQRLRLQLDRERRASAAPVSVPICVAQIPPPIPIRSEPRAGPSAAELEMWADYELSGASFSAGDVAEDPKAMYDRLARQADVFGILDPEGTAMRLGFGGDEGLIEDVLGIQEEDDFLAEIMANAASEIQADLAGVEREGNPWFPYPNKTTFLLNIVDNMPRLRVSNSLMRVFLWILQESGAKNVPSFDRLRKVQKQIREEYGIPNIPCKSAFGNIFYMNDPRAIIAQDWANPAVRAQIRVYPEIPEDGVVREIWHAMKWRKDMDLDALSPMYDAGNQHYYVNELARFKNGDFVIPVRWLTFRGKVHADAFAVRMQDGFATIDDSKTVLIAADNLGSNYFDLEQSSSIPKWSAQTWESGRVEIMPNPKREIAGGDPLYVSFVDFFGDDVSGNRSKSWNKHLNSYMTHRNLPRKLLQQEFHVHFVSTSPHASIAEQFQEFKNIVESTSSDPVRVKDESGKTTRFCLHCNCAPSDNPMQSEICGHIGGKGNKFCRKCHVGGTQEDKAKPDGYHALFEAGELRTKEHTLGELQKQVDAACGGVAKRVQELQTETGVKDVYTQHWIDALLLRFADLRRESPERSEAAIKRELIQWTHDNNDKLYSPFLTLKGFDPAKDTPVELLHTILLGVVKYVWHISHKAWPAEKKKTYSIRLQATDTAGLSIHAIRANYIMQYAGSLIGRQFKTIIQTAAFDVHDLTTEDQYIAWKASGELSALLWGPEIRDMAQHLRDLRVAAGNVLDIVAKIDPSKMMTKIKYHLLAHVDIDVLRFGPLVGVATEIFECFNAVFRYCSIYSNHLAPSRDIAIQLGRQETVKHQLTGGRWLSKQTGEWHTAGAGVRGFIEHHPILQRLVGWTTEKPLIPGQTKLAPLKQARVRVSEFLKKTAAAHALNFGEYDANSEWWKCKSVISASLDECSAGTWVFSNSGSDMQDPDSVICGRIVDVLCNSGSGKSNEAIVILELFQLLGARHPLYGMPVLSRRDGEATFTIVPAKASSNIRFNFNTQHDCYTAKCAGTGVRRIMQERVESERTENFLVHNKLDRFIINMHAFHNAHLLRATIGRDLWAPIPLFDDRKAKHDDFSAQLRDTRAARSSKRKGKADSQIERPRKRGRPPKVGTAPKKSRARTVTAGAARAAAATAAMLNPANSLVAGRPKGRLYVQNVREGLEGHQSRRAVSQVSQILI